MLPRNIKTLGFKFFGGDVEGCLFVQHPGTLQEAAATIVEAKALLKSSGSKWVEMTMVAHRGHSELVTMYAEQEAAVKTAVAPVIAPVYAVRAEANVMNANIMTDADPYSWSNYN